MNRLDRASCHHDRPRGGGAVASLIARGSPRVGPVLLLLVVIPMWTSILVLSYAWMVLPGREGVANGTLVWLGLIERCVTAIRDWPMAAAMSVLLLVPTLGAVAAGQPGSAGRARGGHRPARPAGLTGRGGRCPGGPKAATVLRGGAGLVFLCAPLLIILILSFSDAPFRAFPPEGPSLRWYEKLFSRPDWTDAAVTPIRVARATMVLATLVGKLSAVALVQADFPGEALLAGFMIPPIVVPPMVLAIALFFVFARVGIVGTGARLILAHTVLWHPVRDRRRLGRPAVDRHPAGAGGPDARRPAAGRLPQGDASGPAPRRAHRRLPRIV